MPQLTGGRVLREALRGQAGRITGSALLSTGHQAGEAMVPVVIGVVVDRAVGTGSSELLVWLAVLGAVFVTLSFSFRFGARLGERAAEQAGHVLRVRLTDRVLDRRGGADAGRLPGALASVATSDAGRVGMVALALPLGVAGVLGLAVGAVALLRVSLPLGLLVLLGTPLMMGLAHLLGRPLQRRSEVEQDRIAHTAGLAADMVGGLRVLKGIGAERAAAERYRLSSRAALTATVHAARAKSWHDGTLLAVNGLFLAVVALVGGRLAADGTISVGALIAAVGMAQYLIGPLSMLVWVNGELAQGRGSAVRIAEVLASPAAVGGDAPLPGPVTGRLTVRGLTHAGLRDLDLDVAAGQLVGVVTADPAHAEALVDLLGREREPESGTITLDGHDLSTLDPDAVRAALLVAAHDAELFEGTLRDNVLTPAVPSTASADRSGLPQQRTGPAAPRTPAASTGSSSLAAASAGSDELLTAALAASGADEVAATMAGGVDGALAERGRSLSGGQRQRVALARALAADAPVLVLHEPTTAVDAVTELRIVHGLRRLRAGRTTVVITTSPALLAAADTVHFVADGALTATGTHEQLVREHTGYRATVLA
ncbi:ABC transporter ATP-binding protein [Catellatospora citrea]|uniref:Multidrug ABC transporter ATP-binding protein n=1 Tax=Catellatospora citrea TaxID=53366 RepID=A0A8J3NXU4_9ACTN|nr:ABC transporter ATP-binding protein [Catellatospora citrea]RKE12440.1 putative ABC transport system ATP-binding protein [Catellatospora citrea]GIF96328.1 multidrug ABC transporter ATP-binding protein [Catellatospora citrea]